MPITNDKSLKQLIESRHPTYNRDEWLFHWRAYTGGTAFTNSTNIFKHKKEANRIYQDRLKRAYYYNYVKRLTRMCADFIFQSDDIEREGMADEFVDNVDLKETPINKFMRDMVLHAIVQGVAYAAVDAPNRGPEIVSHADEQAAGVGPYWYRIDRQNMLNWELDQSGKPIWVLTEETGPAFGDPIESITKRANARYYMLWTRDEWQHMRAEFSSSDNSKLKKIEVLDFGLNDIGEVTVAPMYGEKLHEWVGDSWNEDISYIARNLLNVCSLRDDYNFQCAFEMYVFPGAQEEDLEKIAVGSHEVLSTQEEAKAMPFSLSHSGNAATILQEQIADHIAEMHRLTSQRLLNTTSGADGASGVSKQADFGMATNTVLAELADEAEKTENMLHKFNAIYSGGTEATAKYPDDFDMQALERELATAAEIDDLNMPDEVKAFIQKRIVRKLATAGRDQEELVEMIRAIEDKYEAGEDDQGNQPQPPIIQQISTPTGAVNPGIPAQGADNASAG